MKSSLILLRTSLFLWTVLLPSLGVDRMPVPALSASSSGPSSGLVFSADAARSIFGSASQNFTQHRYPAAVVNLFLRNSQDGALRLITESPDGTSAANGSSANFSITADGRFVVFQSDASNLVLNDTNNAADIFLRTLPDGPTIMCSHSTGFALINSPARFPLVTPDGRFVLYEKFLRSLSAAPSYWNIYLRDLQTGETELISRARTAVATAPNGQVPDSSGAYLSDDGRFVVFQSDASNIVPNDGNSRTDIFLRDREFQTTTALSVTPTQAVGNNTSYSPRISADGRWVCFISDANNLVANSPASPNLFLRDTLNSRTVRAPFTTSGAAIGDLTMTADGRFVLFTWRQTIQLWNTQANTVQRISPSPVLSSEAPSISTDGTKIAFLSTLSSVEPAASNSVFKVWVKDQTTSTLTLLSSNFSGTGAVSNDCRLPIISPDGRFVGFDSEDSDLVAGDTNRMTDIFISEVESAKVTLASVAPGVVSPAPLSFLNLVDMTSNAEVILFLTASAISPGDTNDLIDAYIYYPREREFALASAITDTDNSADGPALTAQLNSAGDKVLFTSRGTNFTSTTDENRAVDVFLRDVQTRETKLVSLSLGGDKAAARDSINPVFSSDGNAVAFLSAANDLVEGHNTGKADVFVRNLLANTTIAPGPPAQVAIKAAAISPNGRYLLFQGNELSLADLTAGTNGVIAPAGSSIPRNPFTADSSHFLYSLDGDLALHSIADAGGFPVCSNCDQPFISADGNFMAYREVLGTGTNRNFQVWRHQFSTGSKLLLNEDLSPALFWMPRLSADGSVAAFASSAPAISKRFNTHVHGQVFITDLALSDSIRVTEAAFAFLPNAHSTTPLLSADGSTVVFQSFASNLVLDDKNSSPDIFIYRRPEDTDGDGLPDEWEVTYFGNLQSGRLDDPDGDDASNLDELRAGTNPSGDNSVFMALKLEMVLGERAVLFWNSVPGKRYLVEYKTDLAEPWQIRSGIIQASSEVSSFDDLSFQNLVRFYRVRLVQ